ncbi:MAG: nucleotide exchange factor GrpE [bacterium]
MRKALLEDTTYGATFVLNRELLILEEYTTNFVKAGQNDAKLQELQEVAKKAQYDYVMIKSEFDSYVRRVEGENKEAKAQQLVDLAKKLLPIVTQLGQSVDHLPADLEENTRAA